MLLLIIILPSKIICHHHQRPAEVALCITPGRRPLGKVLFIINLGQLFPHAFLTSAPQKTHIHDSGHWKWAVVFYVSISSLWQTADSHSFLPLRFHRLCSIRSALLQQVCVWSSLSSFLKALPLYKWGRKMLVLPNNLLQRNSLSLPIQHQSFYGIKVGRKQFVATSFANTV